MLANVVLTLLGSAALVCASPIADLTVRDAAIRDSPSYAPQHTVCPSGLAVRQANLDVSLLFLSFSPNQLVPSIMTDDIQPLSTHYPTPQGPLNAGEEAYLLAKARQSGPIWKAFLANVGLTGFDVDAFVTAGEANGQAVPASTFPNVGIAVSGGGERAMLVGGGVVNAFDNRNATSVAFKTGGILQIAQYLAGLSGGSWFTGSFALSNFPMLPQLAADVWHLEEQFFVPSARTPLIYEDAAVAMESKAAAGFNISFIDFYGRALSYHLV